MPTMITKVIASAMTAAVKQNSVHRLQVYLPHNNIISVIKFMAYDKCA